MNFVIRFFHELRNPHCEHCREELMTDPVVEELKVELAALRYERDRLLKYILDTPQSVVPNVPIQEESEEEPKPILPKLVPWNVRRQMLEAEDRQKATLLKQNIKEQEKAIEELEKNLGIVQETVLHVGDTDVQSEPVKVNE